jgi:hypothetical protein
MSLAAVPADNPAQPRHAFALEALSAVYFQRYAAIFFHTPPAWYPSDHIQSTVMSTRGAVFRRNSRTQSGKRDRSRRKQRTASGGKPENISWIKRSTRTVSAKQPKTDLVHDLKGYSHQPVAAAATKKSAGSASDTSTQVGHGESRKESNLILHGLARRASASAEPALEGPQSRSEEAFVHALETNTSFIIEDFEDGPRVPSLITVDDSASRILDGGQTLGGMSEPSERGIDSQTKVLWKSSGTIKELDAPELDVLLRQCAIPHADSRVRRFWPMQVLEQVLTWDRVVNELRTFTAAEETNDTQEHRERVQSLAHIIIRHHLRLFAVLTLINQGRCIEALVKEGVQDTDLPLISRGPTCDLYRRPARVEDEKPIQSFLDRRWTVFHRESFSDLQYAVMPVILQLEPDGRTPKHMDLYHKEVLPFIEMTDRQDGGYGQISTVKVHPDCHGFHDILSQVRSRTRMMTADS